MDKLKVYISSTFKDLKDFRAVLIDFIEKQGKNHFEKPELMEFMYDHGNSESFLETCLKQVLASDIYIIILGKNAGSFPPNDVENTYTMHEYKTALEAGKTIFRFVYSEFKEQECDNLKKYNELKALFEGLHVHTFSDIKDFRISCLECFFSLTDKNNVKIMKKSFHQLISTLNRGSETNNFNTEIDPLLKEKQKVLFLNYQSIETDFAHHLNFRFSNVELTSNLLIYENQTIVCPTEDELSFETSENKSIIFLIKMIADCLNIESNPSTIPELIQAFFKKDTKYIVIPFRLQHSLETTYDEKRMEFLSRFFNLFLDDTILKSLKYLKIIFIINFQREKNSNEIDLQTRKHIYTKMPQLSEDNYLGSLKQISLDILKVWIMKNVVSNPDDIEEIINSDSFSKEYPKTMSKVMKEIEKCNRIIDVISSKNE